MDNNRKGDGGHQEDPEREDGTWMRSEGIKRKTVEEEEAHVKEHRGVDGGEGGEKQERDKLRNGEATSGKVGRRRRSACFS